MNDMRAAQTTQIAKDLALNMGSLPDPVATETIPVTTIPPMHPIAKIVHIVETGNDSYRFTHSSTQPKKETKLENQQNFEPYSVPLRRINSQCKTRSSFCAK